jgi:tripartite-type tricarboxylate transporter receptor subunit TctC
MTRVPDATLGVAVLALSLCGALHAATPAYPVKPIRMLVGFAPGGSTDLVARVIGQKMSERLGQPVVVENRSGADGSIAIVRTVAAAPDGYTMITLAGSQLVQAALRSNLPYDIQRDLTPIAMAVTGPVVLVVNPSLDVDSVEKLIAHARAQPGKLSYGSDGIAGVQHLAAELFKLMAKVNLVHVPYKGGSEAAIAVAGGQIQVGFPSITSALPLVKQGKLKGYAIATKSRSQLAPDLPTMSEAGVPGYEASIWNGILAPAGTPSTIVATLNRTIAKILSSPQAKERYAHVGADIRYDSPEDFGALIRSDVAKWAKVIREAGIRVDRR